MKFLLLSALIATSYAFANNHKTTRTTTTTTTEERTMNDLQEEVDEQLDNTQPVQKRAIRRNLREHGEADADKLPPSQRRDGKNL